MIKLGIIGAGRMGITHYSIINSHPDIEVAAVADPSSLITVMIEKYLKVQTFKDYKTMFKKVKLDAVLLCTPPFLNYEILTAAADLGIHAFVEKPYTTSASQANEIAGLYENKGLVNQVGYVNRFNDIFKKVKELINDDAIGTPVRFRTEMFSRTVIQEEEGSGWRSTRENGGGAIFEMASHSIDLMNFILGAPDQVTGTTLTKMYSKNVEDIVSSTFIYKNGLTGTLYVNWSDESFRKPTNKIEFFGTKGKILADQHGFKIYLKEESSKLGYREGWSTIYITDVFKSVPFYLRGNEFTSQLYHFVDCIQQSKTSECTFREGYKTLSVIEKMFKDSESREKLSV